MSHSLPRRVQVSSFVVGSILNSVTMGLFYPYMILMLSDLVKLPVETVGAIVFVCSLVSIPLVSFATSHLRRVRISAASAMAAALRGLVFILLIIGTGPVSLFIAMLLLSVANRSDQVYSTLIANSFGQSDASRSRWFATNRVLANGGMAIGSILGGYLIASRIVDYGTLSALCAGFSFAAAVTMCAVRATMMNVPQAPDRVGRVWLDRRFIFLGIFAASGALVFVATENAISLDLLSHGESSGWVVGLLFAINSIVGSLVQHPVAAVYSGRNQWGSLAIGFLALSPLMLALALRPAVVDAGFVWVVSIAMIVFAVGESFVSQALTELLVKRGGAHDLARYVTAFGQISATAIAAGPFVAAVGVSLKGASFWGGAMALVLLLSLGALWTRLRSTT